MSKKPKTNKNKTEPFSPDFSSDDEYWTALGQFIEAFTRAENQLFLYLIYFIKVDKMVGKAIFERDRSADLIATLRRVWHVGALDSIKKAELDEALNQLTAIGKERNIIVHNISFIYGDVGRVGTNRLRAHTEGHVVEPSVSPLHLNDMSADLERIKDHFFTSWYVPDAFFEVRASNWPALANAWRYTPRPTLIQPSQQHDQPKR